MFLSGPHPPGISVEAKKAAVKERRGKWRRFTRILVQQAGHRQMLKNVRITPRQRAGADWRYQTVHGPIGLVRGNVTPFALAANLKAHDQQAFVEFLARWCLGPALSRNMTSRAKSAFLGIMDIMRDCVRREVDPRGLDELCRRADDAVREAFTYLPATERSTITHVLIHLPEQIKLWGPAWSVWLYPFERMIGFLKRCVHNRTEPEANMIMVYRIKWFSKIISNLYPELMQEAVVDVLDLHGAQGWSALSGAATENIFPLFDRKRCTDRFDDDERTCLAKMLSCRRNQVSSRYMEINSITVGGQKRTSTNYELRNMRRKGFTSRSSGVVLNGDALPATCNYRRFGLVRYFAYVSYQVGIDVQRVLVARVKLFKREVRGEFGVTVDFNNPRSLLWFVKAEQLGDVVAFGRTGDGPENDPEYDEDEDIRVVLQCVPGPAF